MVIKMKDIGRLRVGGLTCEEVTDALPGLIDGVDPADKAVARHVGSCLRCQAELVQYRRLLRALRSLRIEVLEPAPGALTGVLAAVAAASEQRAIRGVLLRRRAVEIGGLAAAATAAGAGAVIVFATKRRKAS